jgi:hypothetical protein
MDIRIFTSWTEPRSTSLLPLQDIHRVTHKSFNLAGELADYFHLRSDLYLQQVVHGIRDSSVGIATGYGLDDQGEREFESR